MPTFRYDKLVRDNIPSMHYAAGHEVNGRQLTTEECFAALCLKFLEESSEIDPSLSTEELTDELGDIEQLISDACAAKGISREALATAVRKKFEQKGGFLKGEYIETVTIPDPKDELAIRFRKNPKKYPEVGGEEASDPTLPTIEKGRYLHVKTGRYYEVLGVSLETETRKPLVHYRPLYESQYESFARPYDIFTQKVTIDGKEVSRFEKVTDK